MLLFPILGFNNQAGRLQWRKVALKLDQMKNIKIESRLSCNAKKWNLLNILLNYCCYDGNESSL